MRKRNRVFWFKGAYIRRIYRNWLYPKISFLYWSKCASNISPPERERYVLFLKSIGGWDNIRAFRCNAQSWDIEVVHGFLIDFERLKEFNVKILSWSFPRLRLSMGSYSTWIFKRFRRSTEMPPTIKRIKTIM